MRRPDQVAVDPVHDELVVAEVLGVLDDGVTVGRGSEGDRFGADHDVDGAVLGEGEGVAAELEFDAWAR